MDAWDDGLRTRQEQQLADLEELRRTLREHAAIVVARERELAEMRSELARRLSKAGPRRARGDERSREEWEKRLVARERELQAALAAAAQREREAAAEL